MDNDSASGVLQTNDGGYLLTGEFYSLGALIIKTDENGIEEWSNTYNFRGISSIQSTDDNSFIFGAGDIDNPYQLVKIAEDGSIEWNQVYTCFGDAEGGVSSVHITSDGGYIVACGVTGQSNAGDYGLIKTDSLGNLEWFNQFGIPGSHDWEVPFSVKQTADEGYILAGYIYRIGVETNDAWLVKTDSLGNEEWNRYYGGDNHESAKDILQLDDNGYIFTGFTSSYGAGGKDAWLVKIDDNGIIEWDQTFGGLQEDSASSLQMTSDCGYIIAGTTKTFTNGDNDICVIKTDALGSEEWSVNYGGVDSDVTKVVKVTTDGNFVIAGNTYSFGAGGLDLWLVRLAYPTGIENSVITDSKSFLSNYPNPFNPETRIDFSIQNASEVEISIFNMKGQVIKTLTRNSLSRGNHSVIWNGKDENGNSLSSGLYLYQLKVNGKIEAVNRCLLLK